MRPPAMAWPSSIVTVGFGKRRNVKETIAQGSKGVGGAAWCDGRGEVDAAAKVESRTEEAPFAG